MNVLIEFNYDKLDRKHLRGLRIFVRKYVETVEILWMILKKILSIKFIAVSKMVDPIIKFTKNLTT